MQHIIDRFISYVTIDTEADPIQIQLQVLLNNGI